MATVKWTEEIDNFIRANVPCKSRKELLEKINSTFGTDFTLNALVTNCCSKRIHMMLKPWQNNSGRFRGRQPLSLLSERTKKGYVQIKVAQPNVWRQKQVYLYEQAHNVAVDKHKETVIFLNGDNHDFAIENLYLLDRKYMTILNGLRKEGDTADDVLKKIEIAKVKNAIMDLAEKTGLAKSFMSGMNKVRYLVKKQAQYAREYNKNHPERAKETRKRYLKHRKEKLEELKLSDPAKYAELLEKRRAYAREWARRNKNGR